MHDGVASTGIAAVFEMPRINGLNGVLAIAGGGL
jgi:hypothetical protein